MLISARIHSGVFLLVLACLPVAHAEVGDSRQLLKIQRELGISNQLAQVTDTSCPKDECLGTLNKVPDFILIQDVHRNPEVQARIASIILHGYRNWGVRKVFMEGAFAPLDLSLFHRIPKNIQPTLTRNLVHEGDLSGPELAAVQIMEKEWSNPPVSPFQLVGLEDQGLYRKNVLAYQAVLQKRTLALQDISLLREQQRMQMRANPGDGDHGLDLMEKLLRLKLTPGEHEVFMLYRDAAPSTPSLDAAVKAAMQYYRYARLRSRAFLKQAIRTAPASTAPRILVVGGFHTQDMAKLLQSQHRSYVILAPTHVLTSSTPLYEQRMKETVSVYTDALVTPTH